MKKKASMKKYVLFFFGLLVQFQAAFAQSAEVNIPSFDESGLTSFISSTTLQSVIFVVVGVAVFMGLFFLMGNLRMAYNANFPVHGTDSRFPSPTDVRSSIGLPGSALSEYVPQLIFVDNEIEEKEDSREETKGQRGD
jgi:hypothetical protein